MQSLKEIDKYLTVAKVKFQHTPYLHINPMETQQNGKFHFATVFLKGMLQFESKSAEIPLAWSIFRK